MRGGEATWPGCRCVCLHDTFPISHSCTVWGKRLEDGIKKVQQCFSHL